MMQVAASALISLACYAQEDIKNLLDKGIILMASFITIVTLIIKLMCDGNYRALSSQEEIYFKRTFMALSVSMVLFYGSMSAM